MQTLPYIYIEEMITEPKFKVNKVNNKKVPDYLKEDFPSKSLHNARIHVRKMNEGLTIQPTANEYNVILDNFTAIKGVPIGLTDTRQIKKKRNNHKKSLQTLQTEKKIIDSSIEESVTSKE